MVLHVCQRLGVNLCTRCVDESGEISHAHGLPRPARGCCRVRQETRRGDVSISQSEYFSSGCRRVTADDYPLSNGPPIREERRSLFLLPFNPTCTPPSSVSETRQIP